MANLTSEEIKNLSTYVHMVETFARDLREALDQEDVSGVHRSSQVIQEVSGNILSTIEGKMEVIEDSPGYHARRMPQIGRREK